MNLPLFGEFSTTLTDAKDIHYRMLAETRVMARTASVFALPILVFFIWQDLLITSHPAYVGARSVCLLLFFVAGLFGWIRRVPDLLPAIFHGLALASLTSMSCHMVFLSCLDYGKLGETEILKTTASLTYTFLIVLLFSGGLRPWVPLISGLPILILALVLASGGILPGRAWFLFSNPLAIYLICSVLALLQHRTKTAELRSQALGRLKDRQLEALLDSIDESAFLLDSEGKVVICNQNVAGRLGTEKNRVIGRSITDFLPEEAGRKRMEELEKALKYGKLRKFQDTLNGRNISHTLSPVADGSGGYSHVAIFARDMTDQLAREEKLLWEALHDPLTGLLNRRSLMPRLDQAAKRGRRGFCSALVVLDLDGFKAVNDQLGHKTGDQVLKQVAGHLEHGERDHDSAFRIGGDEFALLLEDLGIDEARQVALRIIQRLAETELTDPALAGSPVLHVGASMGLGIIDGSRDSKTLMERCDEAMYEAKAAGRNQIILARTGKDADRA